MAAAIKMDELLVSWLGSDTVYENVQQLMETYRAAEAPEDFEKEGDDSSQSSPRGVIPPFYPKGQQTQRARRRMLHPKNATSFPSTALLFDDGTWLPMPSSGVQQEGEITCVRDLVESIFAEVGQEEEQGQQQQRYLTVETFGRITKEACRFPSFFNAPLFSRILDLWNARNDTENAHVITQEMMEWFWMQEMEPYDAPERFFRLLKQPEHDYIARDDFLPYIKELLNDHPGLEFLSNHAEFQEKYAVTVITRIFYVVNKCHSGRITSRQVRRSDLVQAFHQVDEEEDINKVTRYFSYEHFYVLYCRFWELDGDRDYRITREDLLKYGDHSLSHMIVDRIFDAAPRPFETMTNREFLSYEDFIFFMLSEEDKANEVSVRYWFACVDVDGDGKLNNMEMRSFYAVQLHRMQCMGHEIVPFEDMLCQMMDMIKPANPEYLVAEDFLQAECAQVSGALFDALFNLNKYLMFEQRDPFVERQKREDEFETDWDRFACIDYNRLAMEEEAREEEAMEIDWVVAGDDDEEADEFNAMGCLSSASEAPF
jgi:serine/threonine-protein phosphatase 2A regulatory subunit B''